ncbi:MAG: amidohydrolase family protein [Chloroflexi bacterium]|nr:amidohydrolase family protein [Chloroflexota bacterium]
MAELTLRNGIVVTPSGLIRGGLASEGGQIVAIGASQSLPRGDTDIDVEGKIIFPGVIDPHVHLGIGQAPGQDSFNRELVTESRDAAVGGVTCFVTTTLLGTEPRARLIDAAIEASRGEYQPFVDFRMTSVPTVEEHLTEIPDVVERGVNSFKFFTGYRGRQAEAMGMAPDGIPPAMFYRACEIMRRVGPGVFPMIHAEEPTIRYMIQDRMRHEGRTDLLTAWHEASPDMLEPMQVHQHALITDDVGVPLYVVHVSAADTVDLIRDLRRSGTDVIGETLVGFLFFTDREADARGLGPLGKIQPPIRSDKDRRRLWRGLREGALSTVGTDCVLYSREQKFSTGFWDVLVGLGPALSFTVPVMYSTGVNIGRLGLETMAKVLAENSARRWGLYPSKGVLQVGSDADVIVIDPTRELVLGLDKTQTRSDYTVYDGVAVRGAPVLTFVRGGLVARDAQIVAERPHGRYVTPELGGFRPARQEMR